MSSGASGNKGNAYAVAVLDDMFFASKIGEAARASGVDVEFFKSEYALHGFNPSAPPSLVIVDLANKNIAPLDIIGRIKSSDKFGKARVIGYLPHVAKELAARVLNAGYDQVLPRSRLSRELANILSGITKPES
jgi:DNA-binding NarL/FixJ family response regulator